MILADSLKDALKELFECIIGVFSSRYDLLLQVVSERVLAHFWIASVKEINRLDKIVLTLLVDTKFERRRRQEIVQNYQCIGAKFLVTDGHKEEIFELVEYFQPILGIGRLVDRVFRIDSTTEHEDLHVVSRKSIVLILYDQIYQGVRHKELVEVVDVRLQLVVERPVSETVVNCFTRFERLVRQNDLLDLVFGLDQDIHIERIQDFVVGEQVLELEKADLLDWFGGV